MIPYWLVKMANGQEYRFSKEFEGATRGANFIKLPSGEMLNTVEQRPDHKRIVRQYLTNGRP